MSSFLQLFGQQVTSLLLHPLCFSCLLVLHTLPFQLLLSSIHHRKPPTFSTKVSSSRKPPPTRLIPTPHALPPVNCATPWPSHAASPGQHAMPALIVSSADAAREILKTQDLNFSNRPQSSIGKRLLYDYNDVSLAPYGEYWRQMRSICVLQLLSNKRFQSVRAMREEETALMIEKIKQSCSSSLIDLSETFVSLTNDVVCRVVLGRIYSGGEGGRKFKELLTEFGGLLGFFNVEDYIPWLAWEKL